MRRRVIHSVETVNDGRFHTVELMTFDRMVNLTVDGGEPTTLDSLGRVPRSGEGPLYVGGMHYHSNTHTYTLLLQQRIFIQSNLQ